MSNQIRQILNGSITTKAWRSLVILVFVIISGLGGWMLNEVYCFREDFVAKGDYVRDTVRIEESINKQTSELKQEIKEMEKRLNDFILRNLNSHKQTG